MNVRVGWFLLVSYINLWTSIYGKELVECVSIGDTMHINLNCENNATRNNYLINGDITCISCLDDQWYAGPDKMLSSQSKKIDRVTFLQCKMPKLPKLFNFLGTVHGINMSSNGIEVIDGGYFSSGAALEWFSIRANNIRELPAHLFKNVTKCYFLELSYNRIDKINQDAFRGAEKSLVTLHLDYNRISTFEKETLKGFDRMETLGLPHNVIKTIQLELRKLRNLYLGFNSISELNEHSFQTPALERLNLNNNKLTIIGDRTFTDMKKLTNLDLSHNNLKKLSFQLFSPQMKKLRHLHLSDNKLYELMGSADFVLPSLQMLDISNNEFNCCLMEQFFAKNPRMIPLVKRRETNSENGLNSVHGVACRNRKCEEEFWYIVNNLPGDMVDILTTNHPIDFHRLNDELGKTELLKTVRSSENNGGIIVGIKKNRDEL